MDVPAFFTYGKIIFMPNKNHNAPETWYFDYISATEDCVNVRFRQTNQFNCFYADDQHMGVITKRKNGKWMWKGHGRMYSRCVVTFHY